MRSKLRHPIRSIKEPFGTAGLVVACIALIAALGGTAIAAGALTSKQKKEVEKIAKKFAGKPGATGPAGAKGDPGAAGANGKDGADGTNGANGTNGTNGVSPAGTKFSGEKGGCKEGGVEVKGINTTFVCNGEKGEAGKDGKDGQTGFTETLPSGKTLMGRWQYSSGGEANSTVNFNAVPFPISFGIPLAAKPTLKVHNVGDPADANCPGGPGPPLAEPAAEPGFLCIYPLSMSGEASINVTANKGFLGKSGTILTVTLKQAELGKFNQSTGIGAWAVTAP